MKCHYKMFYCSLENTTVGDDMTCQENKRECTILLLKIYLNILPFFLCDTQEINLELYCLSI